MSAFADGPIDDGQNRAEVDETPGDVSVTIFSGWQETPVRRDRFCTDGTGKTGRKLRRKRNGDKACSFSEI